LQWLVLQKSPSPAWHNDALHGDRLTLFLKMDGDKITDASFQGSGCAISTASVSLMTEIIKGKTEAEIEVA
jgi:nitrogen fixation NifU-like protein